MLWKKAGYNHHPYADSKHIQRKSYSTAREVWFETHPYCMYKGIPKFIFQQLYSQSSNSQSELFIELLRNIIFKRVLKTIIWE